MIKTKCAISSFILNQEIYIIGNVPPELFENQYESSNTNIHCRKHKWTYQLRNALKLSPPVKLRSIPPNILIIRKFHKNLKKVDNIVGHVK